MILSSAILRVLTRGNYVLSLTSYTPLLWSTSSPLSRYGPFRRGFCKVRRSRAVQVPFHLPFLAIKRRLSCGSIAALTRLLTSSFVPWRCRRSFSRTRLRLRCCFCVVYGDYSLAGYCTISARKKSGNAWSPTNELGAAPRWVSYYK